MGGAGSSWRVLVVLALLTAAAANFSIAGALAEEPPSFAGKTIDYYVSAKPGGGYDSYARMIGAAMQQKLPGSTIVVHNKPAGGGTAAISEILGRDPDGLAILTFNTGLLMSQIGGREGLPVDLSTLSYLGKAGSEARVLIVRKDLGIASFADLVAAPRELIFTGSAFGSASHLETQLLANVFKLRIKLLTGFSGSEEVAALMKGESDGCLVSESNVKPLVEAGVIVPLVRFGAVTEPSLAGLPDGKDLATTDDQKLVLSRMAIMSDLGRITATAPGVPAPVLAALRTAYHDALTDPALLAEAKRRGLPIDYQDGEAVTRLVAAFLADDPRYKALVADALAQ